MLLTNEELSSLVSGVVQIKQIDNHLAFYRFSDEQINYFKFNDFFYDRTKFSTSIIIKFKTNANLVSFNYKINSIGSLDSLDVYIDGFAYKFIELDKKSKEGTITIDLKNNNNKEVWIYLPTDCELFISNFSINGKYKKTTKSKEKLLCIGDSITQGYGSFKGSQTYINVMNRKMKFDLLNQGIGGYYFDRNQPITLNNFNPDKILVSLGTNQIHSNDVNEQITDFLKKLCSTYCNTPIFIITPIWRNDTPDGEEKISMIKDIIIREASKYNNTYIINGDTLIPHIDCYYSDLLHPNNFGMEVYGNNLIIALKKIIKEHKL